MDLIILPNQLFEKKYLPDTKNIYLIEEPVYFGFREEKLSFNKLKLVLHRASMKYYFDYLKKHKYNVKYISFDNINYKILNNCQMFKPYDYFLENKYKKYNITYLPNPNFLMTEEQLKKFHKNKTGSRHSAFYNFVKKELDILADTKSYDKMNRNPLPKNIKIPKLPKLKDSKYVSEAKKYIDKLFPKNYGDTKDFIYPITHESSKKWLNDFVKKRFENFGTYQDAIDNENIFIFHSVISPMLNIGLLSPQDVIDTITKTYKSNKKITINDYEGYIRQVIGWREYQRYCYMYYYKEMTQRNIFKNKKKLSENWYYGTTEIDPIDFAIKSAFKYGYLHHIVRLMVMGNFMNLCGIHPDEVYKWMMEFSCDSYDWVMIQNVYSMATWSDKGLTMSKPYISTSNYIMKMSNFKKGEWNKVWDALFYNFVDKNSSIIEKTPYRNNLNHYKKLSSEKKKEIQTTVNKFLQSL